MLLVLRTGGFAVGRYLPVIASLPEGRDAKEVIKEATKVCFDFYTTSGVNLNCRWISRSRQGWRPLKYLTREVSSSLLKGKVMIVPMFLLREQCGYQPVLANLLSKTMYYIAVDPYPLNASHYHPGQRIGNLNGSPLQLARKPTPHCLLFRSIRCSRMNDIGTRISLWEDV